MEAIRFSADAFSRYVPRQPLDLALENAQALPAIANNQQEGIPPPARGVAEPGRMQDLHHIDVAYQGIMDYQPQPLADPVNVFPGVGHAQGIPAQVQPNAPVNNQEQEQNPFGYVPPHVAPGLVQAALPHPFVHRDPTPDPPRQAGAENLRQLARYYLHHPDAQSYLKRLISEAGIPSRVDAGAEGIEQ